jgi:hypothetical protein
MWATTYGDLSGFKLSSVIGHLIMYLWLDIFAGLIPVKLMEFLDQGIYSGVHKTRAAYTIIYMLLNQANSRILPGAQPWHVRGKRVAEKRRLA